MRAQIAYICYAISEPLEIGGATWRKHLASVHNFAAQVAGMGYATIVPVTLPNLTHRQALFLDHALVDAADAIFVHRSQWVAKSTGVARECRWGREAGKPIYR